MRVPSSPLLFCAGAWLALEHNQDQWIQADLIATYEIESVITKKRHRADFVAAYYVSYKEVGRGWVTISTLFEGNDAISSTKINELPDNIVTRYIRLSPNSWSTRIAMRFDVTGCAIPG